MTTASAAEKFRHRSLPLETRVEDLLARLTLEEKVTLLGGAEAFALEGVPRLGVPGLPLTDGPTGVRSNRGKDATVFPVAVSLAASFNPGLAREQGDAALAAARRIERGIESRALARAAHERVALGLGKPG